ncbi:MAG: dehydrogenase [Lewinellaceae bacterium]|nr:dehydrogenase E1 component subunit alpha/beta [Phaeodactylibacter sp.]MCB0611729.1 dehydrogenase E1 component subunit alpha/beta [Phaeodactylibacter sp.]MCB9348706.1 dehydrogenase [Lewinellaceae bacterium]
MTEKTIKPIIQYSRGQLSDEELLNLYRRLLTPRLVEEKMLILLRQGKISKWFSGIGQEAISVGCASALLEDELIFTMHRNLGVFTTRQMPMERLFAQWQGKALGFTKGRDRSFHFGAMDYGIVGMISHLGPQLSLAAGVALAHKLAGEGRVSLAFTGDGATSQGEFHEALNTAAVWGLPVLFVIEDNGYGLSTPSREQYVCQDLSDRAQGYGMRSVTVDGNNILDVYLTVRKLAEELRENPEPVFVQCKTFRMRGHEEASGIKYVPRELLDYWAARDPVRNYEKYLLQEGLLDEKQVKEVRETIKKEISKGLEIAYGEGGIQSSPEQELADVYAPFQSRAVAPKSSKKTERRFVDAISDGLRQAMEKHDKLVLMGQDIADYGGVFKITEGFVAKYGRERVRNTPLCESAIVGIGLGLSLKGYKAMVEMQFADFVTCGFNQIINNLAKQHYRWGKNADVVIRMPTGAGVAAGPFHSQSNEAWFFHTPGLKVVYPSTPEDAKGLLLASFEDPNPVLFFEHKALYRSVTAAVPDDYYTVEIGKARLAREGQEVSVITYGMGVHWATEVCNEMGVDAEILDLRSLLPLDYDAIGETVKKTNRVIVLHEDTLIGGIGGEIAAYISEQLFEYLDAPVLRAASLDTPVPFSPKLEEQFLPKGRFREQLKRLLAY